MAKVALLVLGGCLFFGLLKLVSSEPPHVEEDDLQGAEELLDESQPQERMGVGANAVAFATGVLRPRPNAMPAPTPVTLQLTECYVCTDCPKVISNTTSKVCPHTMDSAKRGKCVVYAEQYKREAVRCWTCSSDLNPYCNDPFVPSLADSSGLFRLEYCDANTGATYPYLSSSKSACKKQKKYIGGQLVISRGCTWKTRDDYSTTCAASSSGANEVTLYCETCEYDGCNGASAVGMTMALIMAPLGLLLFK